MPDQDFSFNKENGLIVHSDLLVEYFKRNYPKLYLVSSTTKVLTDFDALIEEVNRKDFRYVVPDFRLNKAFDRLAGMTEEQKDKVEFLVNECCYIGCTDRKKCYEAVSRKNLGERTQHIIQIDFFSDTKLVLRFRHIIQQKFQYQGTAQTASFYFKVRKSHRQIFIFYLFYANKRWIFHCF